MRIIVYVQNVPHKAKSTTAVNIKTNEKTPKAEKVNKRLFRIIVLFSLRRIPNVPKQNYGEYRIPKSAFKVFFGYGEQQKVFFD